MNEDRIEMSQRERDRLKVMEPVMSGRRRQREAARLLGLSVRQVRRIQRRLEAEGDGAVIHRLRGRPSNRRQTTSRIPPERQLNFVSCARNSAVIQAHVYRLVARNDDSRLASLTLSTVWHSHTTKARHPARRIAASVRLSLA